MNFQFQWNGSRLVMNFQLNIYKLLTGEYVRVFVCCQPNSNLQFTPSSMYNHLFILLFFVVAIWNILNARLFCNTIMSHETPALCDINDIARTQTICQVVRII